jgi:glycosyltransferase involved in cell wall biosynthesis
VKKAIVSVINDLTTDQRVHKVCTTLQNLGYDVTLVGRRRRNSSTLALRSYKTNRMFLIFEKGPLFYLEFQLRLFWLLLFKKADVLVANDLDTLLPNYILSKVKRAKLVYDTHEIFCEVPELQDSPLKKNIWKKVERWIFPKLKHVFTVNDSIAKIYEKEYHVKLNVVRNVPRLTEQSQGTNDTIRVQLNIPEHKKIIVLQGAGINVDRGAEECVKAMQFVQDAALLIIGSGDVLEILKQIVKEKNLDDSVKFIGKVPFQKLMLYTQQADLGLSMDKATNINYRYSLPNKLFDYIHAGIPVLASDLVEVKKIIDEYNVGICISSHKPEVIAETINRVLSDEKMLQLWKKNTKIAAEKLNWEREELQLITVYKQFL